MAHKRIVRMLLAWFGRNGRDLPWRRTRDPYAIWISEVMLQQTQVQTVLPYWQRWMRALPNVPALARATPRQLHKLWEGLGYYARVRNLQRAARIILRTNGGTFPKRYEEIWALPGIGRYTAGAICSIAFNEPRPILDGNVIRVLTRLFGLRGNPRQGETNTRLWALAQELVRTAAAFDAERATPDARQVSHLNQSLMELGALICTPKRPSCPRCPVAACCAARREGRVDLLPELRRRAPLTPRRFVAFVVETRGRFLVRQRPANVVNARLWEFPNAEVSQNGSPVHRAARRLFGPGKLDLEPLCTIKHSITSSRITLEVVRLAGSRAAGVWVDHARWLHRRQMHRLPFAGAHRQILQRLTVV